MADSWVWIIVIGIAAIAYIGWNTALNQFPYTIDSLQKCIGSNCPTCKTIKDANNPKCANCIKAKCRKTF
jgi:hypothetical protein